MQGCRVRLARSVAKSGRAPNDLSFVLRSFVRSSFVLILALVVVLRLVRPVLTVALPIAAQRP